MSIVDSIMNSTKGPMFTDVVLEKDIKYAFKNWDGSYDIICFLVIDKANDVVTVGYLDDMTSQVMSYNYAAVRVSKLQ